MPLHNATPLYARALAFVCTKTQHWPQATRLAALRDMTVVRAETFIFQDHLRDETIKARCRAWWTAVLAHAPKEES